MIRDPRVWAAVDLGNTRWKIATFAPFSTADIPPGRLPEPLQVWAAAPADVSPETLRAWLAKSGPCVEAWWLSSVSRPASAAWRDLLPKILAPDFHFLKAADLPLRTELPEPEKAGQDRLVTAVAVNRLRDSARAAIVANLGTAITVDLLTPDGVFAGGAILPGLRTAAAALRQLTDALPLVELDDALGPPAALGRATVPALQSGLYWGAVGAIRELAARLSAAHGSQWEGWLTGGSSTLISASFPDWHCRPSLTLQGIVWSGALLRESTSKKR